MRELRTLCSICEFKLLATPALRPRLLRATTSRYSTAAQNPSSTQDWDELEKYAAGGDKATGAAGAKRKGGNSRNRPNAPPTPGNPRRPKAQFQQPKDRNRDVRTEVPDRSAAVATFKSIVEAQKQKQISGEDAAGEVSHLSPHLDLFQDVATLEGMLANKSGHSAADCFAFFDTKIYSRLVQTGSSETKAMNNRIATNTFRKMLPEKYQDFDSKAFPTVTRITQILQELGILNPREWAKLMLAFLQHICRVSTSPTDYTSIESYENAMARRDSHLYDLVGAWKVFHVQRLKAMRVGDAQKAAENLRLPSIDEKISPGALDDPNKAFSLLFPHYDPQVLLRVKHAAIATYVVVTDPVNVNLRGPLREEVSRFLDTIGRILARLPPTHTDLVTMYKDYGDLRDYIARRWPDVKQRLAEGVVRSVPSSRNPFRTSTPGPMVAYTAESLHRRIGQALRSRDILLAKATWNHFWGEADTPNKEHRQFLVEHADLFNYFIMAYMSMRQPKLAIQVWSSMERIGIRATLKSWNSMLDGCRRAKNYDGLQLAWNKLVASGIKLDTAIWTVRIAGLIEMGEEDAGLRALAEMARTWRDQDDPRNRAMAVRPTVEPVNAALAGLLLRDNAAAANDLLRWAGQHNIRPDIYTFNTLLRPLVRQGKSAEVQQVFAMMKEAGVEADVATYTIILDGALDRIGDKAPETQIATVTGILEQMAAAGIPANMQVYAKMVYLLLQEGERAGESVKAVLAHIWGKGLELTSHIYTMLAEHYFSRDPPDAAAVDALIETRRLYDNPDVDLIFWERVLKGYCQIGAVDKALHIYNKIESAFVTVGTLHELLSALLVAGDMEAAARVVALARKIKEATEQTGSRIHQNNKRYLRHRFWRLAEQYGLLQHEEEE